MRRWARAMVIGAAALIGAATLTPSTTTPGPAWCVECALRSPGLAANFVVNFALFVPFGIALRLMGVRTAVVAGGALVASLSVEIVQAYLVPGRLASLMDVAANTIGAAAAAVAAPRWRAVVLPDAQTAARLAATSLGGLLAVVAGSAWALTPATPAAPLVVRGLEARVTAARRDRVLLAAVDGRAIRHRDAVRIPGPRERPVQVDAAMEASRPASRGEPALSLVAGRRRYLRLGIEHNELRLEWRRNGAALRLLSPYARLPRSGHRPAGTTAEAVDTLVLRGVVAPWSVSLVVRDGVAHREAELRLHPLAGWSLLLASPHSSWLRALLTALWTGVLAFPPAYWSTAVVTRRPRRLIGLTLLLSLIAVWAIGEGAGAPGVPWPAVIGFILALLAGRRLHRAIRTAAVTRGDRTRPEDVERGGVLALGAPEGQS